MKNLTLLFFLIALLCCSPSLFPDEQTKTLKSPFVGTYISEEQESLLPLLFKAVLAEDEKLVSELIKNGVDVNEKVKTEKPVIVIFDRGKGIEDKIDLSGWTALHMASLHRNEKLASMLLEAKADVNAQNSEGRTPIGVIFLTCFGTLPCLSHEEMILFLVKNGAIVDIVDNNGKTPLDYVMDWGLSKFVRIMIDSGAKHNLYSAIMLGDEKAVSKFLEDGADANAPRSNSWAPLHYAVYRTEIVRLLINKGAKVNVSTKDKETPLHLAVSNSNIEVVKLLVRFHFEWVPILS